MQDQNTSLERKLMNIRIQVYSRKFQNENMKMNTTTDIAVGAAVKVVPVAEEADMTKMINIKEKGIVVGNVTVVIAGIVIVVVDVIAVVAENLAVALVVENQEDK